MHHTLLRWLTSPLRQFAAIAGDVFPEVYMYFVSKLSLTNLDFRMVWAYSCVVNLDFYDHLLISTITPILALVMLFASFLFAHHEYSGSKAAQDVVRHKHLSAALYVAILVYSPVSYRILQTFACDELDGMEAYVRADYRLTCSTPRHSWYEAYAAIMVVVYPVGIPVVFAWLLVWHKRDLVKPNRETLAHLKPLNGIWAVYKPSRFFFEVVECARRISLSIIAAFVFPKSAAQLSIALLCSVVFVFISEVLSPFERKVDMNLYRWGNGIIVASMYVAFLSNVDVGHDTTDALLTFSGVLIAANVFMVVTVLLQIIFLMKGWCGVRGRVRPIDIPVRRTRSERVSDTSS